MTFTNSYAFPAELLWLVVEEAFSKNSRLFGTSL